MVFRYQAIDNRGRNVQETITAETQREAAEMLRQKGMFVTELTELDEKAAVESNKEIAPGGKRKDVVFFTQQMSMLLRSGAQVVQALEAVEEPCQPGRWKSTVAAIRTEVEEGRPLSTALSQYPKLFPSFFSNMISAGEASGDMGLAFDRLSRITRQQNEIRNRVIGALAYPAVLTLMCVGVVITLFTFVLPRFAEMFDTLGVELPFTTEIMISSADWSQKNWAIILGILVTIAGALFAFWKSSWGKRLISRAVVRVPVFGKIVRNVSLATICRIWGQLLESKVSLLDAVHLIRDSITSLDFKELLDDIEQTIVDGNPVGPTLKRSWLFPATFASAVITGEESGRLSDSLLFVAGCLEEENDQVLASLTRVIEPIILIAMGLIVGTVAVSLFMPMFDMATIAS